MKYTFEDGSCYFSSEFNSPYLRSFDLNYTLRENCFNCSYSKAERCSDVTIADFWGYQPRRLRFISHRKGTSLIIVNTPKGNELFKTIQRHCTIDKERTFAEAECGNRNLKMPQQCPSDFDKFWNRYLNGESLEDMQNEYYPIIEPNEISLIKKQSYL